MIKLFFRSGLRSLLRFRQFSLINLIGADASLYAALTVTNSLSPPTTSSASATAFLIT